MIRFRYSIASLDGTTHHELDATTLEAALAELAGRRLVLFPSDIVHLDFRDDSNLAPTFGLSCTVAAVRAGEWTPAPTGLATYLRTLAARQQDHGERIGPPILSPATLGADRWDGVQAMHRGQS